MSTLPHAWNLPQARILAESLQQLPHAMLLSGPRGLGKKHFSAWLAQRILCSRQDASIEPCGRCQNCELFEAGSHPDVHVILPEAEYKSSKDLLAQYALRYPSEGKGKESTVIRIDQIRSLIEASQTRPQIADRKVAILSPADRMNMNASNSLLKLLEEPPSDSYLVLVADRPASLSATIRSRCSEFQFRTPEPATASAWLAEQGMPPDQSLALLSLASGAPLEALNLGKEGFLGERDRLVRDIEALLGGNTDAVTCAGRWKQAGSERCLLWLQGWLVDLVRIRFSPGTPALHNPGTEPRLQALEKRLNLNQLFCIADQVAQARSRLGKALDEQLLLEDVLLYVTETAQTG